jgi:hypothetical protein
MHIGKTGGSSIEHRFGRRMDAPVKEGHYFWGKHWKPQKIKKEWGEDRWNEYFKFSFVRNPWDRMVSMFFFRRDYRKMISIHTDFEEFTRRFLQQRSNWKQIAWFQGCLDEFDFIGRFERLNEDYEYICNQIGAEPTPLPHLLKTDHEHYTEYYTDELRDLVGDAFKEDVETFGYEFES